VAYDVMQPKALRKRDEVAGAEAEAEDGRESEAEGVPLTVSPAPIDTNPVLNLSKYMPENVPTC